MLLTTILNRVEKYKSFVAKKAEWADKKDRNTIYIHFEPRKNSRPICSVFRSYQAAKTALYHQLGNLPKPEFAHRFW